MTRLSLALLGSALATLGMAHAQNIAVFPSDHADQVTTPGMRSIDGASNSSRVPFAYGISRVQMIYDNFDLTIPNGRQIGAIGFARDGATTSTGYQLQLEMQMAQPPMTLSQTGNNFANNVQGTTPTTVFNQQVFALPNLGAAPGGVEELFVPLNTPFTFDNTKILIVEFKITANSNGGAAFNYYLDRGTVLVGQRSYGSACQTSNGRFPTLRSTTTKINANWTLSLSNGPASAPSVWMVGLTSNEPGIPLNVIGLNGCQLLVNPIWTGGYTTSTSGTLSLSAPVPNKPLLVGGQLYSQVVSSDPFAPGGAWVLSDGDEATMHIDPTAKAIYYQGSATNATGSVASNYGLITYFDYN